VLRVAFTVVKWDVFGSAAAAAAAARACESAHLRTQKCLLKDTRVVA
jgi:hypothetical protein